MNYYRFAAEPAQYDYEWDGQALTPVKAAPGALGATPDIPWAKVLLVGALGYVAIKAMSRPRHNPDDEGDDGWMVTTDPATSIDDSVRRAIDEAATMTSSQPDDSEEPNVVGYIPLDPRRAGGITLNAIVNQPEQAPATRRGRRSQVAASATANGQGTARTRGKRSRRSRNGRAPFVGRPT